MNRRKQITFDLDTKILKQIFGEKNYTQAYKDIKRFMLDNGFSQFNVAYTRGLQEVSAWYLFGGESILWSKYTEL